MRLGIIISILMVPICAQATLCEQFMTISDHIRTGRGQANREWDNRPLSRKIGDAIVGTKKPQAVLELRNDEVTKELASHFDMITPLDNDRVRLVRFENPERDAYERINHFETIRFERLRETEYALHLTASADRPAYLKGSITRLFNDGFDFIDYKSRTLYRVEADEFISGKIVDIGLIPDDQERRLPGQANSIWEKTCGVGLIDALKSKMDSAARIILQVQDGSAYGIRGFHKIVVRHLEKLQFNEKGIFIPELNIIVPPQEVVAVSSAG